MLAALLFEGNGVLPMSAADRVGVVGVSEEISRIRTTALQFNRMRDKVLSLISAGLVPFTSLVIDGLWDGNPIKQCNVCREEVTVKNSIVIYFSDTVTSEPVLVLGRMVIYALCGRITCIEHHKKDPFEAGMINLSELYIVLGCEHRKECCDYCGKLNYKAKGLRCANCLGWIAR